MNRGKAICETLKQLRVDIAKANDIEYHPTECTHEGPCSGTCPMCEQELAYLTEKIEEREKNGIKPNWEGCTEIEEVLENTERQTEDFVLEGEPCLPYDLDKDLEYIDSTTPIGGTVVTPNIQYYQISIRLYEKRLEALGIDLIVHIYRTDGLGYEEMHNLISFLNDEKESAFGFSQMMRKGVFFGALRKKQPDKDTFSAEELEQFIGKHERFFGVLLKQYTNMDEKGLQELAEDLYNNCFLKAEHSNQSDCSLFVEHDLKIAFYIGFDLVN